MSDEIFNKNGQRVFHLTTLMKAQMHSIYYRLLEVCQLPGDAIEFGARQGGLSFFLGLCIRDLGLAKKVWLLDSFQGLPEVDPALDAPFQRGAMAVGLETVTELRNQLGLEQIVNICPGWFVDSVQRLPKDARYCLAHLDADLYSSTKTALEYLKPRLVERGAVILDDCVFHGATGVPKAAHEVLGPNLHLHLGPKTQAFLFPKGDPKADRPLPVWRMIGGERYDVADLLTRQDYFELVEWEASHYREIAQWYGQYLDMIRSGTANEADAHRITSAIGEVRRA